MDEIADPGVVKGLGGTGHLDDADDILSAAKGLDDVGVPKGLDGTNGSRPKVDSNINDIINRIPNNLKNFGKCDEFAENLVRELDKEGISYQIIRIDSIYGIYSDKAAMSIGQGYHYGIQIGDVVYDNMTPGGLQLSSWLEDLGLTQGFDSISWKYVDIIINK